MKNQQLIGRSAPAAPPEDAAPGVRCPLCGYAGRTPPALGGEEPFRYLTDLASFRPILRQGGLSLMVAVQREVDPDEAEKNDRIECRDCGNQFPVPEGWEVTFVDLPRNGLAGGAHGALD